MSPRCALLAALTPGLLAGCREIGAQIAVPYDLSPPPAALLEAPRAAAPPVDPRFADALVAFAGALDALPLHGGVAEGTGVRQALRLLATAVALVPGQPEVRGPAYRAANVLRDTVALMATSYVTDLRAQTAHARDALDGIATLLLRLAATDYAGSPGVLIRARGFDAAVRGVDPDRSDGGRSRLVAALDAAEETLQAMLRVAISAR